jgi:hypothetical protein
MVVFSVDAIANFSNDFSNRIGICWTCKGSAVWVQPSSGPKAFHFLEMGELVSPS